MSPKVYRAFCELLDGYYSGVEPEAALEIGAYHWSLLTHTIFDKSRKVASNISFNDKSREALSRFEMVEADSNALPFQDCEFDCVVSCSVFEHDKYFWKSMSEIRRVLRPKGLFVVGVPIYMRLPTDTKRTTLTYARHGYAYNADYYRFSVQAIHEVLLEGLTLGAERLVRRYPNPYLIATGIKHE